MSLSAQTDTKPVSVTAGGDVAAQAAATKSTTAGVDPVAPKPKKKIQRLRTGCWTCRRRGYKCDEGKPHCKNCIRLNICCEGYGIRLKWQDERVSSPRKGKKGASAAGSSARISKTSSQPPVSALTAGITNASNPRLSSPISFESFKPIMTPATLSGETTPLSVTTTNSSSGSDNASSYQATTSNSSSNQHYYHSNSVSPTTVPQSAPPLQYQQYQPPPPPPPPQPQHHQQQFTQFMAYQPQAQQQHQYVQQPQQPHIKQESSQGLETNFVYNQNWNELSSPPLTSTLQPQLPANGLPAPLPSPAIAPQHSSNHTVRAASFDGTEKLLINHFVNIMADDMNCFETYSKVNVFRDVIVPEYTNHDSLKYAICGLAARHMSQLYPEYISMSVEFKVEALKYLREGLGTSPGYDLPSLSAILILAMQEVYESNYDIWKRHVEGAVRGALAGGPNSFLARSTADGKLRLITYLLEYHDTMSSLLSNDPPMLADKIPSQHGWYLDPSQSDPSDQSFVSSLGSLYRAASGISQLSYEVNKPLAINSNRPLAFIQPPNSSMWPAKLNERRVELQIMLSMWTPMEGMTVDMYYTASIVKVACELFYLLRLDGSEFGISLSSNVKSLVADGLRALQQISLQSGANTLHAWPLWQIGVACERPEDQQIVLSRLEQLKWKSNKISLQSIIDYLRLLWYLRRDGNYCNYSYRELMAIATQRSLPVILF